jgi:2-polyprenyl-3-methyl-5-hydroxy-6-metoxy-1,4-benzoquinol methylase
VSIETTTNRYFPNADSSHRYWETRARRYAAVGDGLAAVCSYGMPPFYNRYTQALQERALAPWLAIAPGTSVLELGCGIGRWTERLASAGGQVVGLDLSPTMIDEARRRATAHGAASRCRFVVSDVTAFSLRCRFDFIVGVTVLQHLLAPSDLDAALQHIATHLAANGRVVLLEAAPTTATARCDSPVFTARDEETYCRAFTRAGLAIRTVCPVDPSPLRRLLLPRYRRMPQPLAVASMMAATAASVLVDFAPWWRQSLTSWHKVFVLEHDAVARAARTA